MSPFNVVGLSYAKVLSEMHRLCFDKAWDEKAFISLLSLPTTHGYLNEDAFVLFSVCDNQAEILTLGVLPNSRRKGIAFTLLNYASTELKNNGVQEIFLDVNINNFAARRLYEKLDFKQVAVRKNYYDDGKEKSDALVLKKVL